MEFFALAREIFGTAIELPHRNQSRANVSAEELDENFRKCVYERYECDFDFFGYARGCKYHFAVSPAEG
jgi:hypothetical protein